VSGITAPVADAGLQSTMPVALICSEVSLEKDLGRTLLWRDHIERYIANRADQARLVALATRPDIIVVDRDLPDAAQLLAGLRDDETTRRRSVLIMARGDFEVTEIALMDAGANAILRVPAGPEWDARLERLMSVPVRRAIRFPVQFAIDALPPRGGSPMPALGLNVSVHGVLLESSLTLAVGDEVGLVFRLPGQQGLVSSKGWVVREASTTLYGLEFGRFDGDGRERVAHFVETYQA
jgi:PilZ domain